MRKNSFVIYTDCLEQLEVIPDAERGVLFLEVLKYARTGVVPNIDNPFLKALFLGFKNQIDRDCAKYDEVCKKRAEAGRNGGNQRVANLKQQQAIASKCLKVEVNASNTQANQADNDNESDNESDNVNDNDIDIKKSKGKTPRFTPPTLDDIKNYVAENELSCNAEKFFDFYQSKGWMVGKNKMKDWRAAVRNWARTEKQDNKRDGIKLCNDEWT